MIDIKSAAAALGGKVSGGRIRCPAPGKDRRNRSLSIKFNPDGTFHATDFSGGDWRVARDHVKAILGLSDDRPVEFREPVPQIDVDQLRRQKTAADMWARSVPIAGTLAEVYLASRGLSYGGDALRFYPGGRAMVALMTDIITGEPCGLHRTFLDRHGAKIDRKMLGRASGGVVRLSADVEVTTGLGVAEGIETALAAPFRPIWACLSAGAMKAFPVLPGIGALTVFADQDKAGIDAANACGERWHAAGAEVTMAAPVQGDFADLREAA